MPKVLRPHPPVHSPGTGNKKFDLSPEQERLVREHLGLVDKVISLLQASRSGAYVRRLGDAAVSAGNVALARAAQCYNPALGVRFPACRVRGSGL